MFWQVDQTAGGWVDGGPDVIILSGTDAVDTDEVLANAVVMCICDANVIASTVVMVGTSRLCRCMWCRCQVGSANVTCRIDVLGRCHRLRCYFGVIRCTDVACALVTDGADVYSCRR